MERAKREMKRKEKGVLLQSQIQAENQRSTAFGKAVRRRRTGTPVIGSVTTTSV